MPLRVENRATSLRVAEPPENSMALALPISVQLTVTVYLLTADSAKRPMVAPLPSSTSSPPKTVAPSAPSSTDAVTVSFPSSVMRAELALALTVSGFVLAPLLLLAVLVLAVLVLAPLVLAPLLLAPPPLAPPLLAPLLLPGSLGDAPVSPGTGAVPEEQLAKTVTTTHARHEPNLRMVAM